MSSGPMRGPSCFVQSCLGRARYFVRVRQPS